jgi:hypothetical protein
MNSAPTSDALRKLIEAALRVLVAWNHRQEPESADVAGLQAVFPAWAHLPVDEFACDVIHNLHGIAFRQENAAGKFSRGSVA